MNTLPNTRGVCIFPSLSARFSSSCLSSCFSFADFPPLFFALPSSVHLSLLGFCVAAVGFGAGASMACQSNPPPLLRRRHPTPPLLPLHSGSCAERIHPGNRGQDSKPNQTLPQSFVLFICDIFKSLQFMLVVNKLPQECNIFFNQSCQVNIALLLQQEFAQ